MATSANDGMDIDNNLDAEGTDVEIIADAVANAETAASNLAAHEASVTGHTRKTYSLTYTCIHQSALTLVANADAATATAAAAATTAANANSTRLQSLLDAANARLAQLDNDPGKARAYLHFLKHIFDQPQYRPFLSHDFAFYFEAHYKGFQITDRGRGELLLPLLCNARSAVPGMPDNYSLPAPDHLMVMAFDRIIRGSEREKEEHYVGNTHVINSFELPEVQWKDKVDGFVSRGGCHHTGNPFSKWSGNLVGVNKVEFQLRVDAEAATNGSMIEMFNSKGEKEGMAKSMCFYGCHDNCHELDEVAMSKQRYVVEIDPHTIAGGPNFWQQSSGSAVLAVMPINTTDSKLWRPWELWYTPFLRPYEHYIPASVDTVLETVEACKQQADQCASVGAASRHFMLNNVNMKAAIHYLALLMKHVHDAASL
eukprot:gene26716-4281_t